MSPAPPNQKIFHITHWHNLPQVVTDRVLWSDAKRIELGRDCEIVGMADIKEKRLRELGVDCHPGTLVGQYVPFYFCPRSIMLYILYMGNHPSLTYRGGQRPIVHLQADLSATINWAERHGVRWAFSDRNAGAYLAEFSNRTRELDDLDWGAIAANDWRDAQVREVKQAEFLVFESFPWSLIEEIGTFDAEIAQQVNESIAAAQHRPRVTVKRTWYYL